MCARERRNIVRSCCCVVMHCSSSSSNRRETKRNIQAQKKAAVAERNPPKAICRCDLYVIRSRNARRRASLVYVVVKQSLGWGFKSIIMRGRGRAFFWARERARNRGVLQASEDFGGKRCVVIYYCGCIYIYIFYMSLSAQYCCAMGSLSWHTELLLMSRSTGWCAIKEYVIIVLTSKSNFYMVGLWSSLYCVSQYLKL